jgi:hypothetical protein
MAPPDVRVFFLAGPREGKKDPFLSAHIPQKKMRFDIARLREIRRGSLASGASPGLRWASASSLLRSVLFPSHICTIHEEGGQRGPSGRLERFDIATESRPQWVRVDRAAVLSHHPRGRSATKIDLYSEAPDTGGRVLRVLRFKVPFVHTTSGTFFLCAPYEARGAVMSSRDSKRPDALRHPRENGEARALLKAN